MGFQNPDRHRTAFCSLVIVSAWVFASMTLLTSCRTIDQNKLSDTASLFDAEAVVATPVTITPVTRSQWDQVSSTAQTSVELGCVCEQESSHWQLYRYASANMGVYKIMLLLNPSPLDACIDAKFEANNCKLKF